MKRKLVAIGFSAITLIGFASIYAKAASTHGGETFDQKFAPLHNSARVAGKSSSEIEAMGLGTLTPDSTPEQRGQVYLYLSKTLARDGMPDAQAKQIEYLQKALDCPLLTEEKLQASADLGRLTMARAQKAYGMQWSAHYSDGVLALLRGLKAARDAGVPEVAPSEPTEFAALQTMGYPSVAGNTSTAEGRKEMEVARARIAEMEAKQAARFKAETERKTVERQVQIRDGLMSALATYANAAPDKLPELRDQAMKVFEDQQEVDALLQRVQELGAKAQKKWDEANAAGVALAKKQAEAR